MLCHTWVVSEYQATKAARLYQHIHHYFKEHTEEFNFLIISIQHLHPKHVNLFAIPVLF